MDVRFGNACVIIDAAAREPPTQSLHSSVFSVVESFNTPAGTASPIPLARQPGYGLRSVRW